MTEPSSKAQKSAFDQTWTNERLETAVRTVRDHCDGAEALFRGQEGSHVRLAESAIVQASQVVEGKVTVRVVMDGRSARATTSDLTDQGLEACARAAQSRAASAPPAKEAVELPEPLELPPPSGDHIHSHTASMDAETKERWLSDALRAHRADDLALAGRFHTGLMTVAVQSTRGVNTYHQGSWSDLALSALERPAGHRASSFRARFDARVDLEMLQSLQEEVRQECHRAHDPMEVEPGAWDVVLSPAAVAELMEWMGGIAFCSRAMEDGTSFIHGRQGERVTGEAIAIVDDASMPLGVGVSLPFDVEGLPKRRVSLVDDGVARGIVYDTDSGRRAGCQSTGHAQVDDNFASNGSSPDHLHMNPGDSTVEELIGQVKRGLFITRLHYVNGMLEPRRAVMTGLLRDGAFMIEDGRLGRAVRPLRFTDSMLEAFSRVPGRGGISRDVEAHTTWFGPQACTVVPSLLIPGLRFTSGR